MIFDIFFKKEINKEEKTYPNIKFEKDDSLETIGDWLGIPANKIDKEEIRKRIANLLYQSGIPRDEDCELTNFKRNTISYNLHLNKENTNYTLSFCWENECRNIPEWEIKNENTTRRYFVFHNYTEKKDTLFLREEAINNKKTKFIRENSKDEVIIKLEDKVKIIEIKIENNSSTEIIIDTIKHYIDAVDNTDTFIDKASLEAMILKLNSDIKYTIEETLNENHKIKKNK